MNLWTWIRRVRIVLEMIKFEHSVFALPFALMAMILAARGIPPWTTVFWIVCACVFARSAAMAFNRLVDADIDGLNPRTGNRAIPAGLLNKRSVKIFTLVCAAGFVLSAAMLNRLALALSPVALAVLFGYSLMKYRTVLGHFFLGLALGIAPVGAWIGVRGSWDWDPLVLSIGVIFWTAGFDIIYACQDYEFDMRHRIPTIPSRLGLPSALLVSRCCHIVTFLCFLLFCFTGGLGWTYFLGTFFVGGMLIYEHWIVSPENMSRVNAAFFTVNGLISVFLFLAFAADFLLRT